jgi:ferric-dicitrate binding protein FerR (iron transport regulator)
MNFNDEQVRAAIAEQASEWLVASDERPLDARDAAALAAWLKTSPVHVEEFLGVSAVARDLREARADPEYALDAILARASRSGSNPLAAHGRRLSGRNLWSVAHSRGDDGCVPCVESWLVLAVEC